MNETIFLGILSLGYLSAGYLIYLSFLSILWSEERDIEDICVKACQIAVAILWIVMLMPMHDAYSTNVSLVMAAIPTLMFISMFSIVIRLTLNTLINQQCAERRWVFVMFNTVRGSYI